MLENHFGCFGFNPHYSTIPLFQLGCGLRPRWDCD